MLLNRLAHRAALCGISAQNKCVPEIAAPLRVGGDKCIDFHRIVLFHLFEIHKEKSLLFADRPTE